MNKETHLYPQQSICMRYDFQYALTEKLRETDLSPPTEETLPQHVAPIFYQVVAGQQAHEGVLQMSLFLNMHSTSTSLYAQNSYNTKCHAVCILLITSHGLSQRSSVPIL